MNTESEVEKSLVTEKETPEISQVQQDRSGRYLFLQQINDMCMIAPMINLKKLEYLLDKYSTQEDTQNLASWLKRIPKSEWFSKRQWFGLAHPYLIAWHGGFDGVNYYYNFNSLNNETPKAPALRKYCEQALTKAPITPHFYNQNGQFLFHAQFWFGKAKKERFREKLLGVPHIDLASFRNFAYTPYFFIDRQAMLELKLYKISEELVPRGGLLIPIGQDANNDYWFFNNQSKFFEKTDLLKLNENLESFDVPDKNAYSYLLGHKLLGFDAVFLNLRYARGFYDPEKSSYDENTNSFFPYMNGLYKMMLLSLGLDENNNDLKADDTHYTVYKELERISNEKEDINPWSKKYFNKENFLQYHLAEIFKQNKELFEQLKQTIDFSDLKAWKLYTKFLDGTAKQDGSRQAQIFRSRNKEKTQGTDAYVYEDVLKYIPGPEQEIACILMNYIRLLWYGTLSEKAFYNFTVPLAMTTGSAFVNEVFIANLQSLFTNFTRWRWTDFVEGAYQKQTVTLDSGSKDVSFLDTWKEIIEALKNRSNRLNWVSFDHHGWVISFDKRLVDLQKDAMRSDRTLDDLDKKLQLLDNLGCTGIESSHSSLFNSFYKQK